MSIKSYLIRYGYETNRGTENDNIDIQNIDLTESCSGRGAERTCCSPLLARIFCVV